MIGEGEENYAYDRRIARVELEWTEGAVAQGFISQLCNCNQLAKADKEKLKSVCNLIVSMMNQDVGPAGCGAVHGNLPSFPGSATQAGHSHDKIECKTRKSEASAFPKPIHGQGVVYYSEHTGMAFHFAKKGPSMGGGDEPIIIVINYMREDTQFTAAEISPMLLTNVRQIAEEYYGSTVKNAVITTPACFNDSQRQAIMNAATTAGLNVMQILSDRTGAAIACALDKRTSDSEKNDTVFEVGGGKPEAFTKPTEGFVYYREDNGMSLHPCRLKVPSKLFTADNIEWELCEKMSSKCLFCKKKGLKGTATGKWGYVSKCKDYNFHTTCMMEMSQLVKDKDGNVSLVLMNPMQSTKKRGRTFRKIAISICKTLPCFLSITAGIVQNLC